MKPQNTYKHLTGFVAGKGTARPILQGVHIDSRGTLTATNADILLQLSNRLPYQSNRDIVVDPKSLSEIEGTYPDVNRLIPTNIRTSFSLTPKVCGDIAKLLKGAKKTEKVELYVSDVGVVLIGDQLRSGEKIHINEDVPSEKISGDAVRVCLDSSYLYKMCSFIADCVEMTSLVDIGITSPVKPVLFTTSNVFRGLIAPVRREKR